MGRGKRSLLSKSGEPMHLGYISPFQRPSSSETYRSFSNMSAGFLLLRGQILDHLF